ncbi:YesK family protein [Priestia megaterium]|uniref:Putative membrane protein n=2 Tax=Bacillaceae TaxID=186817 RepID=D5DII6_PRIM3|nr:YesK family protein [Priestia megaterium]ADF40287.1 putative membrane protein [Priestia megaterium DSM 319]MED4216357.1 YesK family protein [Priestia megaterium]WEZ39395.1 YesK family protein [Priestia megaterium DSM 319]
MIGGPLLIALLPGVLILVLTWLFRKMKWNKVIRMAPSILTLITAAVLFYIGYVEVRGFEGAGYLFLSVFLLLFAVVSYIVAKKPVQ